MSTSRAAALYLRSSKDRHDVSIEAQRRELLTLALKRGLVVAAEFSDVVESGKDEHRPGFQQLLRALKAKDRAWSAILMLDTSRLARNQYIAHFFRHECKRVGVDVVFSATPELDGVTGIVLPAVLHAMDEVHSYLSREKGLAGMAENVRAGFRAGGRAPLGYRLVRHETGAVREGAPVTKSRLEPDDQAPAMRAYLERRASGMGRAAAARAAGLELAGATLIGIEWNALTYAGHTVWNVTRARTRGAGYEGGTKRRPRSEWQLSRATHPGLISDDQAERILAALEAPSAHKVRRRGAKFLLSGLLRTPAGDRWWGDAGGRYRAPRPGGGSRYVAGAELERAVVARVVADLQAAAFVRALARAAQAEAEHGEGAQLVAVRAALGDVTAKISRMMDLAAGMSEPGPALRKIEELERDRAARAHELARLERDERDRAGLRQVTEHQIRARLVQLSALVDQDDRKALKETLATMIERIELCPDALSCEVHYRISGGPAGVGFESRTLGDATLTLPLRVARRVNWR